MATIKDLNHLLDEWLRWLRLHRALSWALRGLVLGLALSLVLGGLGLLQARLLRGEFLSLAGMAISVVPLIAGITGYFWPLGRIQTARYFDLAFRLKERISTALELSRENRTNSSEVTRRQMEDAVAAARTVKPRRDLPLRLNAGAAVLALSLAFLIGLVWFRGQAWFEAAQQARAVEQAIAAQAAQAQEILTQVQNNDALSEEQKRALSAPLQAALNDLKANPSLEGSVSILTRTAEKLQGLSDPQVQQTAQALQQAGKQLAAAPDSPLQTMGQALAQGNAIAAASELADLDVSGLNPAEAAQLAGQLEALAQSLASSNPQMASQLNQAAQALQSGDSTAAQAALENAARSLAQAGQQMIYSQTASQAAQQLQQGVGQLLAAGGGQQPASSSGQAQNGQSNQGNTGAGSGESPQGSTTGAGEAGSSPIPQNNGPGDGGQTNYEPIYAPSLPGGDGGPLVGLPSSAQGGDTIGQGPTTPSSPGESLVPFDQVYSQYDEIMRRAMENGEIPLEFMQIIRSYFDSIQP